MKELVRSTFAFQASADKLRPTAVVETTKIISFTTETVSLSVVVRRTKSDQIAYPPIRVGRTAEAEIQINNCQFLQLGLSDVEAISDSKLAKWLSLLLRELRQLPLVRTEEVQTSERPELQSRHSRLPTSRPRQMLKSYSTMGRCSSRSRRH